MFSGWSRTRTARSELSGQPYAPADYLYQPIRRYNPTPSPPYQTQAAHPSGSQTPLRFASRFTASWRSWSVPWSFAISLRSQGTVFVSNRFCDASMNSV